ncbi:4Fe-4S dicluster domain-containing protein [Desulfitobacterium sp. PCE1]|uniref:4Fe-4S dicluster domain-containing protein n=1 Tax=Desulfitobacterium sp. PCE1 TaxID=146907 RepID=UPI00036C1452|nr:4Fe-4S dicluster domain-containing protein [Desulfitobacterium sp. PCE1]
MSQVNVDQKLGVNKFHVDEENAHIVLKQGDMDRVEYRKLVLACPAGLYTINESGNIQFDYAGCLECGTCRVLCGKTLLEKWEFPLGTLGVEFRYG